MIMKRPMVAFFTQLVPVIRSRFSRRARGLKLKISSYANSS